MDRAECLDKAADVLNSAAAIQDNVHRNFYPGVIEAKVRLAESYMKLASMKQM